jgi:hypothetical protein
MLKIPIIFDVLFLLFWVRLWSAPANEFYFNPFLSGTVKWTDSTLAFLRPVLRLPEQAATLLVLLFIGVFKTLLYGRMGNVWVLTIGSVFQFSPPAASDLWGPHFLYSALDTALFFARFWTVYFFVLAISPRERTTRVAEAFAYFARPFSRLPFLAQPAFLLAFHGLLAFSLTRTGILAEALTGHATAPTAASPFLDGPLFVQALKTGWLAVLSFADGLTLLTRALFILIIGNFASSIFQIRGLMIICHETVEMLLGRFARNRAVTGMGLDFTPLIFFFVVSITYDSVRTGLFNLIHSSLFQ